MNRVRFKVLAFISCRLKNLRDDLKPDILSFVKSSRTCRKEPYGMCYVYDQSPLYNAYVDNTTHFLTQSFNRNKLLATLVSYGLKLAVKAGYLSRGTFYGYRFRVKYECIDPGKAFTGFRRHKDNNTFTILIHLGTENLNPCPTIIETSDQSTRAIGLEDVMGVFGGNQYHYGSKAELIDKKKPGHRLMLALFIQCQ